MILATDLDGTFLGGDAAARRHLYEIVRSTPDAVLIYVTGRGVESVLPLREDPEVPDPDFIIADVGATVVHGPTLAAVEPLQSQIEASWPGRERVIEALSRFDFLVPQEVPQERRVSFLAEEEDLGSELERVVREELGCELLFSAEQYLDVLPPGVSKGATLVRLLEHTGLERERVVVAGDTLNDLSLFECDLKGIVVGDAERRLCERVRAAGLPAYLASTPGCGGIVEGLRHHGMLPEQGSPEPAVAERREAGSQQLVIVYHRLPFDEVRVGGRIERRPPKSPNGIIPTLLGFFSSGEAGLWVAWSKQASREPSQWESRTPVDPERYANLDAVRIPLTRDDVGLFYETFSKEAFWPVIFSFPGKVKFNERHWEHYLEINRLFAERTAETAEPGALVWIHDYNLWMVPRYLRELRPDVTIAFFHHTAFPASDIFNIIPWRREIVDSLIQCDYIGFHIPRYVENFVDVLRTHAPVEVLQRVPCVPRFLSYGCALGIDETTTAVRVGEREVRMGAHPVGIDLGAIREILGRPRIHELMAQIRAELAGRTCILSIERLDYVKGPLEKLHAFERLLETHPELHGQIVLLSICTPPAPGMRVYRGTRERVDEAVGRINGRFSRLDWTPVRYFYRSLPYDQVIAHYAVADVAWITPLRDGLNMVAKEFVAANHAAGGRGALVLSEFAGASAELHGALLTNPYDPARMADDLFRALAMPADERSERLAAMHDIVDANDIAYWSYEFFAAVRGAL